MKLRSKIAVGLLSLVAIVGSIGCASMSSLLTPATIDKRAVKYADGAGVIDANEFDGYQNLEKALRLKQAVETAYQVKSLAIKQMQERNQLDYDTLNEVATKNWELAQAREEKLFGPQGLLTLGLGMTGMGALAGFVGLMRKRPGDLTPQDLENAVAGLKLESDSKAQQFAQVVTGVEKFMKANSKDEKMDMVIDQLKSYLKAEQDAATKVEVAKVKAIV